MKTFITYSKNSYSIDSKERKLIEFLLSYFEKKMNMPFSPSTFLNEVDIRWSPEMLDDDSGVFGMWHWLMYSKIFIVPMRETLKNSSSVFYSHLNIDFDLTEKALYLLDYDGIILSSIFHELWHRQQFTNNPIAYLLSSMLFAFIPYETSCKSKLSIEYDVRQKVDTDELKSAITEFSKKVKDYLYFSNILNSDTAKEDIRNCAIDNLNNADQKVKDFVNLLYEKD